MITYELAKKIYKNGSPFKYAIPVTETNIRYIDYPPLKELIKACGYGFRLIHNFKHIQEPKDWVAVIGLVDGIPEKYKGFGDTPEEAVSNLWLSINKK